MTAPRATVTELTYTSCEANHAALLTAGLGPAAGRWAGVDLLGQRH